MKIGIDTFGCVHGRSGLGAFLVSLLNDLPKLENIEYEFFGAEMDRFTYAPDEKYKFKAVNVPDSLAAERWFHRLFANRFARKNDYSVVFYTAATKMLPLKYKVPGVAFINDVFVENMRNDDFWAVSQTVKSLKKINAIIASSEYIKKNLVNMGIDGGKITVIRPGIDHSLFYPRENIHESNNEILEIKPFAIKRPYLIYASKLLDSNKKHVELIKAFTLFKEKTHLPHRLVIAGSEGPYGEEVHKAAFASSAASDIFITGFFPLESFAQLYRYADACLFPAVNEGSGLSVMEAMASGVPVCCSSEGALPEIAGENVLYFDSNNVEQMAGCIEQIITDSYLRERLVKNSLEWTSQYSWKTTAEQVVDVLKKTAENSK